MTHRRFRRKKQESGQALAELAISLIAILALISGFLLISGLGVENVRNVLEARETADKKARGGLNATDGVSIRQWDYGEDEIPFTRDDSAVKMTNASADVFIEQFIDNTGAYNLRDETALTQAPTSNNFASNLDFGYLFLNAASLTSGRESEHDPLGKRNLSSMKSLIKAMFGIREFSLDDTVYMPSSPINSDNLYR